MSSERFEGSGEAVTGDWDEISSMVKELPLGSPRMVILTMPAADT